MAPDDAIHAGLVQLRLRFGRGRFDERDAATVDEVEMLLQASDSPFAALILNALRAARVCAEAGEFVRALAELSLVHDLPSEAASVTGWNERYFLHAELPRYLEATLSVRRTREVVLALSDALARLDEAPLEPPPTAPSPYRLEQRLLPPPPTAPDEHCRCAQREALKLVGGFVYNPVRCLVCNGEVPPAELPLDLSLANRLADWCSVYNALYAFWLDSGTYEAWATRQLLDLEGEVHAEGRGVARELEARSVPTYYWWSTLRGEAPEDAHCPACGDVMDELPDSVPEQRICRRDRIVAPV